MNLKHVFAASSLIVPVLASAAAADIPGGDVFLEVVNGQIRTGRISEDGLTLTHNVRDFGGEFGDPTPNTAEDPGLMGPPGTFAPGTPVGFNILAALRVWNGTDFSTTSATISLSLGPLGPITTPPTDMVVPGFFIPATDEGEWHHHPTFTINADALAGSYLLELNVLTQDGSLAPSLPFWEVWNYGDTPENQEAAFDWVQENLVPAPFGLWVVAMPSLLATRRRRAS